MTLIICMAMGGEGSNGGDGRIVGLLQVPINATVKEIVTRLLATTEVRIKYSRGEQIRNTNRAQMRKIATRRWRRAGLVEIIIIFVFDGATCAYSPAGAFLIYLSLSLGGGRC